MKVKTQKFKKKAISSGIVTKNPNKQPQWKKVKLSGNLLSDDGGLGLEGFLGLEVLENPSETLRVNKEKPMKLKRPAKVLENSDDDDNGSDSGRSKLSKNERKKKKKLLKKAKEMKAAKTNGTQQNEPGRFVRPPRDDDVKKSNANHNLNNKKKAKKAKPSKPSDNIKADEAALSINDLIGWNGFQIAEPILKVMAEKGFREPTEIQALTFPAAIMGRRDILGAAETGSGKTLAFGIPILNGILHMKKNPGKRNFRKLSKKKSQELNQQQQQQQQKPSKKCVEKQLQKTNSHDERENLTPPPEEINNFPDFVNEEGGCSGSGISSVGQPNAFDDDDDAKKNGSKPLYALILTPTRELAVQVRDHLVAAAKYTGIHVAAIFGGMAAVKQERILSKCPEIVVATPGRLWELLNEGNPHLNKLQDINFLVVDETDRMIEKGHFDELKLIIERLNGVPVKKEQRQNFIFSATLTFTHELPQYLKVKNMNRKRKFQPETTQQKLDALIQYFDISQPKIIDVTRGSSMVASTTASAAEAGGSTGIAKKITECRISCPHDQKDLYLYYFLQKHPGRTIVFCNSIDCVRRLAKLFTILECQPQALHAKMAQRARLKSLERFTANPLGLLIATDVAARGLDIPNVEHVIHYQVPRTTENYIHRSGRTARGNKEGIAIIIMEPEEINDYVKLCRTLKRNEDLPIFPVANRYLNAVRDRVNLARRIDVAELHVRRKTADIGWLKKSAKEMDILIDDESDFSETDLYGSDQEIGVVEQSRERRELKQLRNSLKHLLAKPVFPKGFSYKYPTSINIDSNIPDSIMVGLSNPTHCQQQQRSNDNALDVMKNAIEEHKLAKKQRKLKIKL